MIVSASTQGLVNLLPSQLQLLKSSLLQSNAVMEERKHIKIPTLNWPIRGPLVGGALLVDRESGASIPVFP